MLETSLQGDGEPRLPPLDRLAGYYTHLAELAKGYEKDDAKLQASLSHVYAWRNDVERLAKMFN